MLALLINKFILIVTKELNIKKWVFKQHLKWGYAMGSRLQGKVEEG